MNAIHRALCVAAFASLASAAAHAEDPGPCRSQSPGGDARTFACTLPASADATRWTFTALFTGGHDDTQAALTATLGGRPLACDERSKTRLFGEDGEVSLHCSFRRAPTGDGELFEVRLTWGHADYSGYKLLRE